jgi:hypothetical protein
MPYRPGTESGRWSGGATPPGHGTGPGSDVAELDEVPVSEDHNAYQQRKEYFAAVGKTSTGFSAGSGSSGEGRENSFGEVGNMMKLKREKNLVAREKSVKNPEELRRRGSVDERAMTITGRLFVANPDLSD